MRYDKILKSIVPTKSEEARIERKVKAFVNKLEKHTKQEKIILGGSFAKGTWLQGKHDIDIFVAYNHDKNISEELESLVKKAFRKVTRIHGSRDYFQIKKYGLQFEIVPVYKIKEVKDAHNVTDVSPLHVVWVKGHMTDYLKKEIRLVKAFCQANDLYGAETYIKGFSGYVLEILTIHYGCFINVLKAMINWKEYEVINPSKKKITLPKEKRSILTVIDPVQPTRNASAAIAEEKWKACKKAAETFLAKPSEDFFVKKEMTKQELRTYDIVVEVKPLKGKKDIVGTKILKVYELCRQGLDKAEFGVAASGWFWKKKAYLYFNVHYKELPEKKKQYGPPKEKQTFLKQFKEKHGTEVLEEDEQGVYIFVPRGVTNYKECIKQLIEQPAIKDLAKKIKIKH